LQVLKREQVEAFFISDDELDVGLCVSSGQVFRFRETEQGWVGVDGDNVIEAVRKEGGWSIHSRPERERFRRFFQLDRNLSQISHSIIKCGPELKSFVEKLPGLRVLRPARVDETLFSFLCTPNNHLSRIQRMVNTLGSYGKIVAEDHYVFPSVDVIANISESELRDLGFGYRAATICRVANYLATRPTWLESLRGKTYEDARGELIEIEGIGLKVADCVCLFGLGHEVAVPVDTHLWQAACAMYMPHLQGKGLTTSRYLAVGNFFRDRFGELAGWAHQYLFYNRVLSYRSGRRPIL
jgi:N-glycosylase/DNA lyase